MTATEEFQNAHGGRWALIANGPEFPAALTAVNIPILLEITDLEPEVIASPSGNVILARLQGQLRHERALLELAIVHPDMTSDLPASDYLTPEEDAAALEAADKQDSKTGAHRAGGSLAEWFNPPPEPAPETLKAETLTTEISKPKRKRTRRKT